ncbi:DUF5067 domain-containing protein [Miniphocaeibacter massiliensis]|uniref:DUF5067 domain-containing protein n=1 Tax=Miniphocaeibacter massiliensis TaxID=2041841 RepID=UPI000C1B8C5A|nr:DUF5067 domain-containing protein [Miniphocaeibacter massiliensis]
MKKKLLILGLIMTFALTACGGKDKEDIKTSAEVTEKKEKLTKEEIEYINYCIEVYNEKETGQVVKLDEKNRTVNFILDSSLVITDAEGLKESYTNLAKVFSADIKDFNIKFYFEDDVKNPLLVFKDGKIYKDDFDKYLKEHPEKKEENQLGLNGKDKNKYETKFANFEFISFDVMESNLTNKAPLIVLTINITNNQDEEMTPVILMSVVFDLYQKDSNLDNAELFAGSPEIPKSFKPELHKYNEKIKPGETFETVVAYSLFNTERVVKIIDSKTSGKDFNMAVKIK